MACELICRVSDVGLRQTDLSDHPDRFSRSRRRFKWRCRSQRLHRLVRIRSRHGRQLWRLRRCRWRHRAARSTLPFRPTQARPSACSVSPRVFIRMLADHYASMCAIKRLVVRASVPRNIRTITWKMAHRDPPAIGGQPVAKPIRFGDRCQHQLRVRRPLQLHPLRWQAIRHVAVGVPTSPTRSGH